MWYNATISMLNNIIIRKVFLEQQNISTTKRELSKEDIENIKKAYQRLKDNDGLVLFSKFATYMGDTYGLKANDIKGGKWINIIQNLEEYEIVKDTENPSISSFKLKGNIKKPNAATSNAKQQKQIGFLCFQNVLFSFSKLAEIAKKEDWGYKNHSLIEYFADYSKIIEQDEERYISYNKERTKGCFNTKLHTKRFKDIFACFDLDKDGEKIFKGFYTEADRWLSSINLPEAPIFDVKFDTSLNFRFDSEHIIKNKDRLPKEFSNLSGNIIINIIEKQAEIIKKLLEREPYNLSNIISPIYYDNKICFLFPIFFTEETTEPDILLTCEKQSDTSYVFKTILTPDMPSVYRQVRIIAKPNAEWIKPKKES